MPAAPWKPPVLHLLLIGSQSAVLREVPLIVVYAVNLESGLESLVNHPLSEDRVIKPFVAYRESTSAVILVAVAVRVAASRFHAVPDSIHLRPFPLAIRDPRPHPFISVLTVSI